MKLPPDFPIAEPYSAILPNRIISTRPRVFTRISQGHAFTRFGSVAKLKATDKGVFYVERATGNLWLDTHRTQVLTPLSKPGEPIVVDDHFPPNIVLRSSSL